MCYQLDELYTVCRCRYYQHPINKCASYGLPGHAVQRRTVLVGVSCEAHMDTPEPAPHHIDLTNGRLEDLEAHMGESSRSQTERHAQDQLSSYLSDELADPWSAHALRDFSKNSDNINYEHSIDDLSLQDALRLTDQTSDSEEECSAAMKHRDLADPWSAHASLNDLPKKNANYIHRPHSLDSLTLLDDLRSTDQMSYSEEECSVAMKQKDVTDMIIQQLLYCDKDLRSLWPQINSVSLSTKEARHIIERLLRQYAGDLLVLAEQMHPTAPRKGSVIPVEHRLYFNNVVARFDQPGVEEGRRRIHWKCRCGQQLFDDFIELHPGALIRLENLLKGYDDVNVPAEPAGTRDNQGPRGGWRDSFSAALSLCHRFVLYGRTPGLPQHCPNPSDAIELGTCISSPEPGQANHNFVLLCVPFLQWGIKVHQAEICTINSDQEFFRLLQRAYKVHRRPMGAWKSLRKVRAIHFVKFEMYRSKLADIQMCPSIPPEDHSRTEYAYEPRPAETIPPIGPNLLMHLFEHPTHADVLPVLYRRFPKKLRSRLEACPRKGSSVGWGIQFVEGADWFMIFAYGCLGFCICLCTAVTWSVRKGDVQGGFAIAGYLLAFCMFCIGMARSKIEMPM
ncbi:hypothetical protein NKR23_g3369 [Pleurostoma richardsiae]|uniref:Uncharacterized protein n=1 Tax=Pleurostoma richardsiae TaxID=41990 RepID=A0AA38VH59_9PEZI|nr:hypothetical protein NKR23_g3369 [Pleurostoma richardsiae]